MSKKQADVWKKRLIEAMEKNLCIVSTACKEVGIDRDTYYKYYRNDPEFKRAIDDLDNHQTDFVESQLFKKIKEGDRASIIFYMRYKGKKRGYCDSLDVTTNGSNINEISIIKLTEIKKEEEDKDDDIEGDI